eukprot:GEMP01015620.1.p1 GENE.GEMP01015620.1~~GEMP01015620.1.p1  ORF type:complete len:485 (-),score=126.77 GEMP01015620.1:1386-2840(-)
MAASPEAPRGFPEYPATVHDTRFTVAIRNEIEDLCRRLINRQKKLKQDRKVDEEKWFNERVQGDKGPLHMVLRYVKSKGRIDSSGSFVLVLGASNDDSGVFCISPSTHDFPWFTIVMNDFCNSSSEESFNAWQLVFNKQGQIRAKALSDETVSGLSEDDKLLLERAGFRLPGRLKPRRVAGNPNKGASNANGTGKPSNAKAKKANNQKKEEELDPNDPLYEFRVRDRQISKGCKRIRTISRKVRMNAGMTKERRERTVLLVERLNKKFYDVMERLQVAPIEDQTVRKPSTHAANAASKVIDSNAGSKDDASAPTADDVNVPDASKDPDVTPSAAAADATASPTAKRPLTTDGDDNVDDKEGADTAAVGVRADEVEIRADEVEMMADPTVCIGGSAGLLLEGEGEDAKNKKVDDGAESEPEEPGKGWKILQAFDITAATPDGQAAASAEATAETTTAPTGEDAATAPEETPAAEAKTEPTPIIIA